MNKKLKIIFYLLLTLILTGTGYIWYDHQQKIADIPFDAELWRSNPIVEFGEEILRYTYMDDELSHSSRYRMLKDLTTNILPGMKREQIIGLLGPSENKYPNVEDKLYYRLRSPYKDFDSFDYSPLVLEMDGAGNYTGHYIAFD